MATGRRTKDPVPRRKAHLIPEPSYPDKIAELTKAWAQVGEIKENVAQAEAKLSPERLRFESADSGPSASGTSIESAELDRRTTNRDEEEEERERVVSVQRKVSRKGGRIDEEIHSRLRSGKSKSLKEKHLRAEPLAQLRRVVSRQRENADSQEVSSHRASRQRQETQPMPPDSQSVPFPSRSLHRDSEPIASKLDPPPLVERSLPVRKVALAPKVASYPGFTTSAKVKPQQTRPPPKQILNDGKAILKSRRQELRRLVNTAAPPRKRKVEVTDWKQGQAKVKKILGKLPQTEKRPPPSSPPPRRPLFAAKKRETDDEEEEEGCSSRRSRDRDDVATSRKPEPIGFSDSNTNILQDLKINDEESDAYSEVSAEAPPPKPALKPKATTRKSFQSRFKKKGVVTLPFAKPIEKSRHYDPNAVKTYMSKQLAQRRNQQALEKKAKQEKERQKRERLQSLYDYQKRHVKACIPKYRPKSVPSETEKAFSVSSSEENDSDKENNEVELPTVGRILNVSPESLHRYRPFARTEAAAMSLDGEELSSKEVEPPVTVSSAWPFPPSLPEARAVPSFSPDSARVRALKESALSLTAQLESEAKRLNAAGLLKNRPPASMQLLPVTSEDDNQDYNQSSPVVSERADSPEQFPSHLSGVSAANDDGSTGLLLDYEQTSYPHAVSPPTLSSSSYLPERPLVDPLQPWERKGGDEYSVINIYARRQRAAATKSTAEEEDARRIEIESTQSLINDAEPSSPPPSSTQRLHTQSLVEEDEAIVSPPPTTPTTRSVSPDEDDVDDGTASELKYSPDALSHRMAVELHQLDVLEEGMRQAAALERTHAVARAQEETVTLARLLRGKQEDYQRGIDELAMKAREEMLASEKRVYDDRREAAKEVGRLQEKVDKTRAEASEIAMSAAKMNENVAVSALRASEAAHEVRFKSAEQLIEAARDQVAEAHRLAVSTATAAASAAVEKVLQQHEERIKSRMASSSSRVDDESFRSGNEETTSRLTSSLAKGSRFSTGRSVDGDSFEKTSRLTLSGGEQRSRVLTESVDTDELVQESEMSQSVDSRRSEGEEPMSVSVSEAAVEMETETEAAEDALDDDDDDDVTPVLSGDATPVLSGDVTPVQSQVASSSSPRLTHSRSRAHTKASVTGDSYTMQFEESNVASLTEEGVEAASDDDKSFLMVLPSESHRRHTVHKDSTSHDDVSQHSSMMTSPFSGDESFESFTGRMVRQLVQDEEMRAQHQSALLKLREKALNEKSKAELEWLQQKEKRLRHKGEDDKMPLIKERQKKVLSRLAAQKAEIRRLMEANRVASYERQQLLVQQREVAKMKKASRFFRGKLKQRTSSATPSIKSSSESQIPRLDFDASDQPETADDSEIESVHLPEDVAISASLATPVVATSRLSTRISTAQDSTSTSTHVASFTEPHSSLTRVSPSSGRRSNVRSTETVASPSDRAATASETLHRDPSPSSSVIKRLRKLQAHSSEKYLTKRERKLRRKREEAEKILKDQRELLEWTRRLNEEEAEVKRILSEAMQIETQRRHAEKKKTEREATIHEVSYTDTFASRSRSEVSPALDSLSGGVATVQESLVDEYSETFEGGDSSAVAAATASPSRAITEDVSVREGESFFSESMSKDLGDLEKRIRFLKNELAKRKAEAKKLRLETKRQKEMALKSQEAKLEAEIKNVDKIIRVRSEKRDDLIAAATRPPVRSQSSSSADRLSATEEPLRQAPAVEENQADSIPTPPLHEVSVERTEETKDDVVEEEEEETHVSASRDEDESLPSPSNAVEPFNSTLKTSTPLRSVTDVPLYSETFETSILEKETSVSEERASTAAAEKTASDELSPERTVVATYTNDFESDVGLSKEAIYTNDFESEEEREVEVELPASSPVEEVTENRIGDSIQSPAEEKEKSLSIESPAEKSLSVVQSNDDVDERSEGLASGAANRSGDFVDAEATGLIEGDPELDRVFSAAIEAVESLSLSVTTTSVSPDEKVDEESKEPSPTTVAVDATTTTTEGEEEVQRSLDLSVKMLTRDLLDESLRLMLRLKEEKRERRERAADEKKTGAEKIVSPNYDVAVDQLTNQLLDGAVKEMGAIFHERRSRRRSKDRAPAAAVAPLSPPLSPKRPRDIPFPSLDLNASGDESTDSSSLDSRVVSPEIEVFPVVAVQSEAQRSTTPTQIKYTIPFNRAAVDDMVCATMNGVALAEGEEKYDTSFRRLVFDLTRDIEGNLGPTASAESVVVSPAWMKPKRCHANDLKRMKVAHFARNRDQFVAAIQEEVASLMGLGKGSGAATARRASGRKGSFSKATVGRPTSVEAILVAELKEEESQWIDYDEDEQDVTFQVGDGILDMLLEETATVVQGVMNDKMARRQKATMKRK